MSAHLSLIGQKDLATPDQIHTVTRTIIISQKSLE